MTFVDKPDGSVDIAVELFNNSMSRATAVLCEFFHGKPTVTRTGKEKELSAPPGTPLGTKELKELGSLQRDTVILEGQHLTKGSFVTVRVSSDDLPPDILGNVYWGVYPADFLAPT